ncbi:trypsin-like peptidase domain-containing protein [Paraflavisolibacter sp. H34]|uniref:trypsin-like peptidase domain-containing protein n=1 Tax=Huijunlia imazamoxiresistens TaxID=3127457 RepID=UPI00301B3EE1
MENKRYFFREGGRPQGPFTLEELQNCGLHAGTEIWHPGLHTWTKAAQLPDLQPMAHLLPPEPFRLPRWLVPALALVLLVIIGYAGGKFLLGKKAPVVTVPAHLRQNNQQLYSRFAPGVVLIRHQYIYQATTNSGKFYFNEFTSTGPYTGDITGLTTDSLEAVQAAEPHLGTAFFVSSDGKLLTNRQLGTADPGGALHELMVTMMVHQLDKEGATSFNLAEATVSNIAAGDVTIITIPIDLQVFLPGTPTTGDGNGIRCHPVGHPDDPTVDLSLVQVENGQLPVTPLPLPDLSRIARCDQDSMLPQLSERLVLIGYPLGTGFQQSPEGIKSQLSEGWIDQNAGDYTMMYSIPLLPGYGGAPVLDEMGRLVSVNAAAYSGINFNYGVQPARIRDFLKKHNVTM